MFAGLLHEHFNEGKIKPQNLILVNLLQHTSC